MGKRAGVGGDGDEWWRLWWSTEEREGIGAEYWPLMYVL